MGLRDLKRRLTASIEELDANRLQDRYQGLGLTPVAGAPERVPIRIGGEITKIRVVPRAGSPALEVTVSDGRGAIVGVFLGRRKVAGMSPGRRVALEGVAARDGSRVMLFNPVYELLT